MTKKILCLLLAFVMILAMFAGCSKPAEPAPGPGEEEETPVEPEAPTYSFGMVTDVGGIGDNSFTDSAWAGIE